VWHTYYRLSKLLQQHNNRLPILSCGLPKPLRNLLETAILQSVVVDLEAYDPPRKVLRSHAVRQSLEFILLAPTCNAPILCQRPGINTLAIYMHEGSIVLSRVREIGQAQGKFLRHDSVSLFLFAGYKDIRLFTSNIC
jgi:hypothetical protein